MSWMQQPGMSSRTKHIVAKIDEALAVNVLPMDKPIATLLGNAIFEPVYEEMPDDDKFE